MVCRGGFMGFRSAIDTNLCSKPALSECRGGFYNYLFFPPPDVTKPAPTVLYSLFSILYSLFPVLYSLFSILYSLFSILCSLFSVPRSLFSILCSLFSVPYSPNSDRAIITPTHQYLSIMTKAERENRTRKPFQHRHQLTRFQIP